MSEELPLDPLKQIENLRALRRLEELKDTNGLMFYEPHAKQDEFHANGQVKRRYVRTGNRFGKSTMGGAEDCGWAIGERPWYKQGDPRRTVGIPRRSTKGLIIVADWDKAHEIFTNPVKGQAQGKLFKFLPKDSIIRVSRNNAGVISEITVRSIWGGESSIMLDTVKSFMSNPMGQESSDWDWIHVDEPCPKDMWVANSRGLIDRDGSAWFTCTPIDQPWINDMFIPRDKFRLLTDESISKDVNHLMIVGSSYDNPHNSEAALQMFEAGLTEEQKQCRIQGIPLSLSGLVYKEFHPSDSVYRGTPPGWQDPMTPPENYTIRLAIDPHPQVPHAVLFAATSPEGQTFFFAEIFRKLTAEQLCEAIHEITAGRYVHINLCDPAAYIPSNIDQSVMADVLIEHGVFVEKASKDLSRGIITTQAALAEVIKSPRGTVQRKLLFAEHLQETRWEFDHYTWNPARPNKPIDKHDHMMENLYRLVLEGLDYVAPENDAGYKYIPSTIPNHYDHKLELPHYGDVVKKPRLARYG
jgi:hypothetical protein